MRLSWIVCAWIAGVSVAAAQPPAPTPAPPVPAPEPTPAEPAPPTNPAPAPVTPAPAPTPEPAPAAKKQSAVLARARAEAKCARREPDCDWLGTLSSLERQSVARGLARRGYELEPSPWGKVIAEIRVYNEDVFAEKNRLLQFFNNFHVTTKEHAIRENVLISIGEVWDPLRVEETARRLRDPLWSSVVVVLPVKSAEPGKVDLLVVTRDIWSLRLNTQYTFQQGSLTNFSIALSENNFLGRRILFAWGLTLDQGTLSTGPVFLDRNLVGTNLQLRVDARVILNRENLLERLGFIDGPPTISEVDTPGFVREGSESSIALQRPLFLSSKWGVGVQFSHRYAIDRRFRGLGLLPVDCSRVDDAGAPTCEVPTTTLGGRTVVQPILDAGRDTMDGTILGVQYEMRHWDASASAVRQWGGQDLKHQLTVGHAVDSTRPRVLPSFPYAPGSPERIAFEREVLPRSEVTSTPFISYGLFTPSFRSLRNIDTYDLAEDVRFGLGFDASYSVGLEVLGSTRNFQRGSLSGSWTQPWCRDGFLRASAGISTRFQDSEFIDNTATGTLRFVSPTYRWARLVAQSSVGVRWNDTVSAALGFFSIGSANGLRGFQIAEFRGQRLLRNQVELRSLPIPVWVLRAGGVLFYDLGGAGDSLRDLQLHHNIGVGFRMLLPQTARELFRFDFAVPLDGDAAGAIRFIAGFESAF